MQALQGAAQGINKAANGEACLRLKLNEHVTLNSPYDQMSVDALYLRLRALAKEQFEKLLSQRQN